MAEEDDFGTVEERKNAMLEYQQKFIDLQAAKPELTGMIEFNWEKMSRASVARIHEIGKFVLGSSPIVIDGTVIACENKPV